jgi:hypothetical protein
MSPTSTSEDEPVGLTDAVSDAQLGHDIGVGVLVGTPLVYLAAVLMGLAARVGAGNALVLALVPGAFGGVFFGGVFPLSRQMASHERHERARVVRRRSDTPASR